MNSETSIFVGCLDGVGWVRIEGIATKDTSGGLRRYFSDSIEDGLRKFIIDLEDCRLVDSTFIGILTGLAGRLDDGEVKVIHSNERNEKSICKLGVDKLITIEKNGPDSEKNTRAQLDRLEDESQEKFEQASMILQAHEDLCSANEENVEQFGDVLDYLKQDLEKFSSN